MREIWKPIDANYQVSNLGRVRGKKILKQRIENGRLYVNLYSKPRLVARLVLEAWRGPSKEWAIHKDGTADCKLSNLVYRPPSKVIADTYKRGRPTMAGELCGHAKISSEDAKHILSLRGQMIQTEIGKLFGLSRQSVCDIHNGRTWNSVTGIQR